MVYIWGTVQIKNSFVTHVFIYSVVQSKKDIIRKKHAPKTVKSMQVLRQFINLYVCKKAQLSEGK